MMNNSTDSLLLASAQFVAQAFDLEDTPEQLADDLSLMRRDSNASIFSIQLDTSVGRAGFLVYSYLLERTGGDGHTGQEQFDMDLNTMQQSAVQNTPGPRPVAHANTDEYGFILATAPGTWRALTGAQSTKSIEAQPDDALTLANTENIRAEAATRLFDMLRDANAQAETWLNALQAASRQAADDNTVIAFTDPETELALFLLDDDSVGALLRTMNLLVATAQNQAAEAMMPESDDESDWPQD